MNIDWSLKGPLTSTSIYSHCCHDWNSRRAEFGDHAVRQWACQDWNSSVPFNLESKFFVSQMHLCPWCLFRITDTMPLQWECRCLPHRGCTFTPGTCLLIWLCLLWGAHFEVLRQWAAFKLLLREVLKIGTKAIYIPICVTCYLSQADQTAEGSPRCIP